MHLTLESRSPRERLFTRMSSHYKQARDAFDNWLSPIIPHKKVCFTKFGERLTFQVFRGDHIGRKIAEKNFYEHDLLCVVKNLASDGGVFVDAGAFIGNHSVFFSKFCGADNVISIEPSRSTFLLLSRNLRENCAADSFELHNVAVGQQEGFAKLPSTESNNRGGQTVELDPNGSCRVTTIDALVGERNVALIKIDVEGKAYDAILGAEAVIQRCKPFVVAEALTDDDAKVVDYLCSRGYQQQGPYCDTPTYVFIPPANGS